MLCVKRKLSTDKIIIDFFPKARLFESAKRKLLKPSFGKNAKRFMLYAFCYMIYLWPH